MSTKETVAILGGTGDLGTGLAIRWSKAGYNIVIGSRTLDKAQAAVEALQAISPDTPAQAMENGDAAAAGDIVVLTVPAAHQISTLDALKATLKAKSSSTSPYHWCRPKLAPSSFLKKAAQASALKTSSAKKCMSSVPFKTLQRTCCSKMWSWSGTF